MTELLNRVLFSCINPGPLMLTGLNFLMCMCVMWGCFCRLRLTSTETKVFPRLAFVATMIVCFASGFRGPLFGDEIRSWWPIVLTTCLFLTMQSNIGAWRHAPPPNMQKPSRPMPLQ